VNAGASLFRNGLTPLPMVEKELSVLSGLQQQGQVTTLLNQEFTPSSFSSGFAAASTRQVHIASHAEIAAGPQRIPTIYTGDTALSLRELGQLRQRAGSGKLDLVTLSACRSALNGADLELGFAGLAVQLGANTAIGTKWYVDDLATSSFFVLFYRDLQQGMTKAEALRATQQAFSSGQVRVEGTNVIGPGNAVLLAELPASYQHRYARGFSHPYYWAGVQLVGSPW
jgi:CHAT domain-containing protein